MNDLTSKFAAALTLAVALSTAVRAEVPAVTGVVLQTPLNKTVWTLAEAKESFENGSPIDAEKLPGDWKRVAVVKAWEPNDGVIDLSGLDTDGEGGKLSFSQKKNPLQEAYTYVRVHKETGDEPVYCKRGPASLWFQSKEKREPNKGKLIERRTYACRLIHADHLLCMKITEFPLDGAMEYAAYAKVAPAVAADALDESRRAHLTTWSTLRALGQFHEVFCDAGRIKIADLSFWYENGFGSKSMKMAGAIDGVFIKVRGAKRLNEDARAALAALLETGKDEGRNLRWLADQIEGLYQFYESTAERK
ncbi:MAG: hypothetical protein HY077_02395 [Elusimicrobia bacterium]|nr:hypothetical protein [Elusimicrobiota bacterium]